MTRDEEFSFTVDGQRLAGTRITPAERPVADVLALHGLGATSTRHRIRYLLDAFAAAGHGSVTFEFSGNGESTGVMSESTLRIRRRETLAAAGWLLGDAPPVVLGTSMGAHLAAATVPELRPRGLVLFCPAAYPGDATDLRFDGSLAPPGDYPDSPAYAGIREFEGDLLIIATRQDQVIPPAVIDGYLENARRARSAEVVWIDGCDHLVHRWLPDQPELRTEITQAVLRLLSATAPTSPGQPRETTSRVG